MRMIVAALIGGLVIGFVDAKLLAGEIQKLVADPGTQAIVVAALAAFLGAIWGWVAKGIFGSKARE